MKEGLAGREEELLAGGCFVVRIGPFEWLVFALVEDESYLRIDALGEADAMGVVFGCGKDQVVEGQNARVKVYRSFVIRVA